MDNRDIEARKREAISEAKAMRFNEGKRNWSLIDWDAMEEMVKVLEFGAKKYAPENWRKGLNRKELLESAQRHLVSLFKEEENDQETNLMHAGHIMANMMFYIWMHKNNKFVQR